jgi:hypothetical protein
MENRLFLLEEPVVPTGLTENILSGVDVTPEKDYSGKITLTQLNAYSGELKAEALTNFQTIKIEKDGSETYTNVAKLLIELQQGGGVEDAREEAIIEIESKKGDAELRNEIRELGENMSFLHHTPESYAAELGDVLTSAVEYIHSESNPSVEDADGIITEFKSRDIISQQGEEFLVVLNGVVVTREDGDYIISQYGTYKIGFKFNVAPSVGDVVEFFGTRIAGKSSGPYVNAISENEGILSQNSTNMDDFQVKMATIKAQIESDKAQIVAQIEELKKNITDFESSRIESYKSMLEADSIKEVSDHSEKVKSLDKELGDLRNDSIEARYSLDRLVADEISLNNDEAESNAKFEKIKKEGEKAGVEFNGKKDMFEAIANELKGGGAA